MVMAHKVHKQATHIFFINHQHYDHFHIVNLIDEVQRPRIRSRIDSLTVLHLGAYSAAKNLRSNHKSFLRCSSSVVVDTFLAHGNIVSATFIGIQILAMQLCPKVNSSEMKPRIISSAIISIQSQIHILNFFPYNTNTHNP